MRTFDKGQQTILSERLESLEKFSEHYSSRHFLVGKEEISQIYYVMFYKTLYTVAATFAAVETLRQNISITFIFFLLEMLCESLILITF